MSTPTTLNRVEGMDDDQPMLVSSATSESWLDSIARSDHNELFLKADFASTSLGEQKQWGPALRLYASMVFADSRGAGVYWGPDKIAFYNEKFAEAAGGRHPFLMAHGFYEAFPEIGELMRPGFDHAYASGQTMDVNNMELPVMRNGFLEETYFTGQFIPIRGDSGEIEGLYNTVMESTAETLAERRRRVIDQVIAIPPIGVAATWDACLQALRDDPRDIPFAALYSYTESTGAEIDLVLRGSIGAPRDHPSLPGFARLETSQEGLIPFFREAKLAGKPLVLSTTADGHDHDAIKHVIDGFEWCGFEEASQNIVISPLTTGGSLLGFYVQGTNPRRPFDKVMEMSIADLALHMGTKLVSSMSQRDLELRQKALEERMLDSERRLRQLAHNAPVGMVHLGLDCAIEWANEQFYQITGHDRSKPDMADFTIVLAVDYRESGVSWLKEVLGGGPREARELRLARSWIPPVAQEEPVSAWVLVECFPVRDKGQLKTILAYITDISHQKWAENIQHRNAASATAAKQQQEKFIDITCHEMRNPLSAITQLADGIVSSIGCDAVNDLEKWREIAKEGATSASTILACAAHQKRIIDDVLMLSRLSSDMLTMRPVVDRPSQVIGAAVNMLHSEVEANNSTIRVVEGSLAGATSPDYVLIDPSRLLQVLINLISNAIKFCAAEPVRDITVSYGAHKTRPTTVVTDYGNATWVPVKDRGHTYADLKDPRDNDERLFLCFIVSDTGPGILPSETKRLFKRFSQTGTRSHVSYTGSGLGLYICKQLVEKQGGRIGFASHCGKGTAFVFYIESRTVATSRQASSTESASTIENPAITSVTTELAQTRLSQQPNSRPKSPPQSAESASSRPSQLHVLLVEDNLINQKVLAKQLRQQNCIVHVADHGMEALGMLEKTDRWSGNNHLERSNDRDGPSTVDVILMDVEMPVMDGLQCTEQIRKYEKKGIMVGTIPILCLTANARQEQKEMAFASGANDVLIKPVTVKEVVAELRSVIRKHGSAGA